MVRQLLETASIEAIFCILLTVPFHHTQLPLPPRTLKIMCSLPLQRVSEWAFKGPTDQKRHSVIRSLAHFAAAALAKPWPFFEGIGAKITSH
jgi:hypothetical protein